MVELVIVAGFVLVPLFLAIPLISKYLDMRSSAVQAARYAAWERTVWYDASGDFAKFNKPNSKSAAAIRAEIAARMLYDRKATKVIQDTDKTATTFVNGTSTMWEDNEGTPYLDKFAQLDSKVTSTSPKKDVAGKVLSIIGKVKVGSWAGFVPPLPSNTLAVANVTLKNAAATSGSYQRLWSQSTAWNGIDFKATGAILSNTWSNNGRDATEETLETMVPTAQTLGKTVVRAAQIGIAKWDLTPPAEIDIGRIAPDVVPKDRLK